MKASILSNNISGVLAYPRLLVAPRIRISRVFGCLSTITRNPPSCSFTSLAAISGVDAPEMEWPAKKVRDTFIKFFEGKNHVNWKSSPVVPHNDPTLLFANAVKPCLPILNLPAVGFKLNNRPFSIHFVCFDFFGSIFLVYLYTSWLCDTELFFFYHMICI